VSILVDKELTDRVVEVRRKSDGIISIQLAVGDEVLNMACAYAPQVGSADDVKKVFSEELEEVMQSVP